jgi:hypothetical protein
VTYSAEAGLQDHHQLFCHQDIKRARFCWNVPLPRRYENAMSNIEHSLTTALTHVRWLAAHRRHTTANDRWVLIAESQGWVHRVPGVLDDPAQFRVELTPTGQRGVLPALTCHCCDERIVADVTWLPLVTASGSVALHPVHGACGLHAVHVGHAGQYRQTLVTTAD